ncbi:dehydrogenase [Gordonibacter sp. An230]|uniref:TorD/DmsD family molecular chaperone n=1 Tax=Gordonibacter sp. An230 TaxID=1965592 RepID=UPI000B3740D7|nr:molecular chaperone TorD family protein [Gordonibacter sp. An230]OUO89426.1 dehydrogenase [Gordonibacter sp. An230]
MSMTGKLIEGKADAVELAEVLERRSTTYALLSRLYVREVDQELLDEMHASLYPVSTGDPSMDEGYRLVATYLSNLWTGSLSELKVDYARCFLGNGVDGYAAAYPYESVYTSEKRLMMQDARDEVLAVYRACGVGKASDWREGEDHIALELEFERVMGRRAAEALRSGDEEGACGLLATQKGFLEEHLASWAPMMLADMRRYARTKLYLGLAHLTEGWLRTDSRFLRDVLSGEDGEERQGKA